MAEQPLLQGALRALTKTAKMSTGSDKLPTGLSVDRQDGLVVLVYQHHRGAGLLIFVAGLFWALMLVPAFRFLAHDGRFGPPELVAFLPFLIFALGFGYVGLAKLLNKTQLSLTSDAVTVHHHPIPWFGNVEVATHSIKGFQVLRDLKPQDIRHRVTVALVADLNDGTQVRLLRAISDSKAARRMHEEATSFLRTLRAPGS